MGINDILYIQFCHLSEDIGHKYVFLDLKYVFNIHK